MDKYTKFILTMIAVGIIGINFQLFGGDIISKANAVSNEVHKIAICNRDGTSCADISGALHFKGNFLQIFNGGR